MLKKIFFTEILVPASLTVDLLLLSSLPCTAISVASSIPFCFKSELSAYKSEICLNSELLKSTISLLSL